MKGKPLIVKGKYPTEQEKRRLEKLILQHLNNKKMSIYELRFSFKHCSSFLVATSLFRLISRGKIVVMEEREGQKKRIALYFRKASPSR